MKKDKYKIVNMVEHELNQAYIEGYEIVSVFNDDYIDTSTQCQGSIMNNSAYLNMPAVRLMPKALMQLNLTAEVLYGNKRTNNE